MNKPFIALLTDFVDANGKKILDQPDRFKSLFLDFSQNQYRAEVQIFSQFLASKQAQELKNADDVDTPFLKGIVDRFYQTHFFDKDKCTLLVMAYAWFLGLIDKKTFEAWVGGDGKPEAERASQAPVRQQEQIVSTTVEEPAAAAVHDMPPAAQPTKPAVPVHWVAAVVLIIVALLVVGGVIFDQRRSAAETQRAYAYELEALRQEAEAQQQREAEQRRQQHLPSEDFVRINGGTFTMGSPAHEAGHNNDEGPQHQVTVSAFYMGKYAVMQNEYQQIAGTNPSHFKGYSLPVEQVTWFDAIEYCNKRSQKEGLIPAYTRSGDNVTWNRNANGYRLPTEAEWEYACRAGTTTAYNTGASINNNTGWYNANSNGQIQPVGQKPANAWGLYDMHGNVWEWCWDWYGSYSSGAQTDPVGASSGSFRVYRGGGWSNSAGLLRSAYRLYYYTNYQISNVGFRMVRP